MLFALSKIILVFHFVKSKIINLPMDKYLKHIHIDEKLTSIPNYERSVDYEIS